MEEVFDNALAVLDGLDFEISAVTVERGRSSLTPGVQQPFGDLMQSVLDDVIAFNRTSCALSNFPDEHHLSKEYRQVILRDIAAAWLEFSLSANRLLVAKARRARSPPASQPALTERVVMNEGKMDRSMWPTRSAGMNDIPSQKARGFQLMIVGEDGSHRPWSDHRGPLGPAGVRLCQQMPA